MSRGCYVDCSFFRFSPRRRRWRGISPDQGKPTLFVLAPLGAAIVTNLVLKPHAEACSFGLFYSIVAITLRCWEIVAIHDDVTVTSPLP